MTPRVVTLWYRAPELLLGAEVRRPDSMGCPSWALGSVSGQTVVTSWAGIPWHLQRCPAMLGEQASAGHLTSAWATPAHAGL